MNAQLAESSSPFATSLAAPVTAEDHVRGAADALVTVVGYGDFQSPECAAVYRVLKAMPRDRKMNWRYVYRHLPLVRPHPQAVVAAEAAEAAAAQGLFWDLHDAMFEHQGALSPEFIRKMARRLGVDLKRYDADLREHRFADRIKRDLTRAVRSGADTAPTLFIDSVRFDQPLNEASMSAALLQRIAAGNPRLPLAACALK